MDPAFVPLLSVGIGAGLAILTSWLTNHYAKQREDRQWERQHQAEVEKWHREQKVTEAARLKRIYAECVHQLGALEQHFHLTDLDEEVKTAPAYVKRLGLCHKLGSSRIPVG